jgi:hypothetical protein
MPFASEAQRRWMHATHPAMAERWEHETKKRPRRKKKAEKKSARRDFRRATRRAVRR